MQSPATGGKISVPLTEYLKSIPEFVGIRVNEEPTYDVLERTGDVEIRRYAPMATATVPVQAEGEEAREEAFKRLAAFIFGENQEGETLAMTSPVVEDRREMTFVLPKRVLADGVPNPTDPSIRIAFTPSRTVAALRYGGDQTTPTSASTAGSCWKSWMATSVTE